jgi:hypothetical chaperone protein
MPLIDGELIYGLDFGTTNSSLSIFRDGCSSLISIDPQATKQDVARSALYFYPKKLHISDKINKAQLGSQTFTADQIWYEGEEKYCIGQQAVTNYLQDNRHRHKGILRKVYTGRYINVILYTTPSGRVVTGDVPEYYEEIDFGTGRLLHALKTALKSESFKSTNIFGQEYTLEKLIGIYVSHIKSQADQYLKSDIKKLVCGRPVKFSDDPRIDKLAQDKLEQALHEAGFTDIKFQFEPVAAAKYYHHKYPAKNIILVFDFGGGTFDTTIIDYSNKKDSALPQVLTTNGVYIGGDLLNSDVFYDKLGPFFGSQTRFGDNLLPLPNHIMNGLKSWYEIPNLNNPTDIHFLTERAVYKCTDKQSIQWLLHLIQKNLGFELYEAIEVAKKELTYNTQARIVFKDLPIDIDIEITRDEFEQIISPRINLVKETVMNTLELANLKAEEVDVVVRTGGSSLIPMVENMLVDIFGQDRVVEFDPFTSVAGGLSI